MDTVLHSIISWVGKSLHVKEYTLAYFLDIKGVINNAKPDAIVGAIKFLNIEQRY